MADQPADRGQRAERRFAICLPVGGNLDRAMVLRRHQPYPTRAAATTDLGLPSLQLLRIEPFAWLLK
jgi:hypothetical protein